jgi:PAS domain S-box-containing protein
MADTDIIMIEKPTVLIVEDSPDDLTLISGLLKDLYNIKIATNGKQALKVALRGTPPDIILLDIMMPVMDGYETCRHLKADPETLNIPVIFLTSKTELEDEIKGFELGAVDYITKPISPPVVLARVKTHLQLKCVRDYLQDKKTFLEAEVQRRTQEVVAAQKMITEQWETLRDSEKRYRQLFDSSPDGILVIGPDGCIVSANITQGRMFRYDSTEELIGVHALHLVAPSSMDCAAQIMQRRLNGEDMPAVEYELIRKDGTTFYGETMATIMQNADGTVSGYILVFRDTTERRKAEHQIRERMKELQAFFTLSDLVAKKEITTEELLQEFTTVLPKSWQSPEITCARIVISGKEFRTQNFSESPWMQSAPINVHGSVEGRIDVGYLEERPVLDEGPFMKEERLLINAIAERLGHFVGRKQAEEALQKREEYFRAIIENSTDIILIVDKKGTISYASPSIKNILGYKPEEIIGTSSLDLIVQVDVQSAMQGFGEAIRAKGAVVENMFRVRHKDGSERILEGVASNLFKNPAVAGFVMNVRDVTERKRAEEEKALNVQRIQTLLQLNQMTDATLQETTDFALEEAVRLTQSTIGYLAFLNKDESVLTMHSWSKSAMAECAIIDKPIIYPVVTTGLWGEAVRQRRPVFTNDYAAANPLKKGYPEGHVAVKRHMNVPVFDGSRIVIVAGVGNKNEEYNKSDAEQLILLMESMWRLIERQRAEVAMHESELKHRILFETAADAILLMRGDRFIDCNTRTMKMFGCTREQIIGAPPFKFSPPTQPDGRRSEESAIEKINQAIRERPQLFEWEHCRWDQTPFYAEVSLNRLELGGEVLLQAIIRDITERKRAEKELQESEQRFMGVLRSSRDAILLIDGEKFVDCNEVTAQMLGYANRDEFLKTHPSELSPPTQPDGKSSFEKANEMMSAAFERGFHQFEWEHRRANGKDFPVEVSLTSVMLHGKNVLHCVWRDITDRKQAEEDSSLHNVRTKALLDLHLMMNESQQAILDFVLEAMQKACRSQFAFIGLMDETESIQTIHAWSKDTMAQCATMDKPIHFPISEAGVWGDCVRQRKPVTINDYEAPWPSKKGYPDGHVPIRRFLSVPIFDGERIVAVAAVANKKEPYTEDDGRALNSLVNKMWEILRREQAKNDLEHSFSLLQKALTGTVQAMATVVESRDSYTAGHQRRVAELAHAIASEMNLPIHQIEGVRMAAVIHDLGKIVVPAEILSKPTKLKKSEFELIQEHPLAGYEILKDIEFPWPIARIVLEHHEKMDGSGYPNGSVGENILLESKIIAVADVFEAMSSHRPYRPSLGIDAAFKELEKSKGTKYDATVVEVCLSLFREKGYQLEGA